MKTNVKNVREIEGVSTDTYAGKAIISLRTKLLGVLGDSGFLLLHLMDFVNFMILHDRFASKGIYITDENKEEKYIEILEMDDPTLLQDLEKYLSCLENFESINNKIYEYTSYIEKIKELENFDDIEAVNNIVGEYLKK